MCRALSLVLMAAALAVTAFLWASDARQGWQNVLWHERLGAVALILGGSAYLVLQGATRQKGVESLKGILLGLAFVLWGTEQFLPAGPVATAIDGVVISIFVVDLSLMIWSRLRPSP